MYVYGSDLLYANGKKHPVGCNFIRLGDQPPDLHLKIKQGNYQGRPSPGTASDGALAAIIEDSEGTAMFQECSPTTVIASALSRGVGLRLPPAGRLPPPKTSGWGLQSSAYALPQLGVSLPQLLAAQSTFVPE